MSELRNLLMRIRKKQYIFFNRERLEFTDASETVSVVISTNSNWKIS